MSSNKALLLNGIVVLFFPSLKRSISIAASRRQRIWRRVLVQKKLVSDEGRVSRRTGRQRTRNEGDGAREEVRRRTNLTKPALSSTTLNRLNGKSPAIGEHKILYSQFAIIGVAG